MDERSSSRGTAPDRLQRILYVLPAAGSEEGASMEELCEALAVTPEVLLADMAEVTARDYYLPAGRGDSLRITYDAERIRVSTTAEFRRPPRLTARETLTLGLGLRILAGERTGDDRESVLELARRLETGLAVVPEIEFAPDFAIAEASAGRSPEPDGSATEPARPGAAPGASRATDEAPHAEMRGILVEAARERRACSFRYLKAGADEPEDRRLEPYVLVASSGRWYAVGHDPDRDRVRVFRLDRMLDLTPLDDRFERDPDFDLDRYLTGAYVYRAPVHDASAETGDGSRARDAEPPTVLERARVRYSPAIARWILEREQGEALEDGAALVEHVVTDPGWASRHVLRYGGDAELLGPADLRARVVEGARRAEAAHS